MEPDLLSWNEGQREIRRDSFPGSTEWRKWWRVTSEAGWVVKGMAPTALARLDCHPGGNRSLYGEDAQAAYGEARGGGAEVSDEQPEPTRQPWEGPSFHDWPPPTPQLYIHERLWAETSQLSCLQAPDPQDHGGNNKCLFF